MRLRQRLILFSTVLLAAPALISFAAFYLVSQSAVPAMRASVTQRATLERDKLVQAAVAPLAADDDAKLAALVRGLGDDPGFGWAVILDDAGKVRAAHGDAGAPEGGADAVTLWAPVSVEGLVLGKVGVHYLKRDAARVASWSSVLGVAALAVAVAGLGFSVAFARRFVRPIEQMKQFAAAVARGDLAHRIGSRDRSELGELARHLDTMTAALEARDLELSARRAELERALEAVRATQEELMRSSRLAAVGEMAGRTAHEVLNPAQSLHGRLARMAGEDLPAQRQNADVLRAIVDGWKQAGAQGPGALWTALSERLGGRTVLELDLAALDELARWAHESGERAAADLTFLERELGRITRIVDGMRSLSRQRSSAARHPLAGLLAEACEIIKDSAARRAIGVRWTCDPSLEVEVDRYELLQVLTNLLRNALPAIEQRHGRAGGQVELEARARDERVAVSVRDDGAGIDPEHVPHIFEPTFTTRGPSEGTGLGLGISRRLVRQMGGELSLAGTAVGAGTTFVVELPLAGAAPDLEPRDHDQPQAA